MIDRHTCLEKSGTGRCLAVLAGNWHALSTEQNVDSHFGCKPALINRDVIINVFSILRG